MKNNCDPCINLFGVFICITCADQLLYELQSGGLRKKLECHLALVESLFHSMLQMLQLDRQRYAGVCPVISSFTDICFAKTLLLSRSMCIT